MAGSHPQQFTVSGPPCRGRRPALHSPSPRPLRALIASVGLALWLAACASHPAKSLPPPAPAPVAPSPEASAPAPLPMAPTAAAPQPPAPAAATPQPDAAAAGAAPPPPRPRPRRPRPAGTAKAGAAAAPVEATSSTDTPLLADYLMRVSASRTIRLHGPAGELRVWLGLPDRAPAVAADEVSREAVIGHGQTARVTPFANREDVRIEADAAATCYRLSPDGAEIAFRLYPGKPGPFAAGARADLFDSPDCSGPPVPKTSRTLAVDVVVDVGGEVKEKVGVGLWDLGARLWQGVLSFWDKLVLLVFALLLLRVRKRLYAWAGVKGGGRE